ncbi:MAG: UDP-N-acetylmuramoyl-L-alanyl-D-glutamate--2,6-diaminopimelate ligase [Oscillospiraceae bacterium]|nr:UDP-N-acetylmuramoyl-L-alanyl-D-glutamate--2,6-diaminopimelate ligase [Oscillospiraceae bacterium]
MKLKNLLADVQVIKASVDINVEIGDVCYDSRKVTAGSLFVAVVGYVTDGNRYITKALENGASAVVTAVEPEGDIPYVLVESDRLALAQIGANFYGRPAETMKLIGITGTNGKTSSTLLLKHILEKTKQTKVGLIGTMDIMIGDQAIPAERTTPESLDLQRLFAQMRDAGCEYAIMEVSSHAIALDRVGGLAFDVAAFTNLTEDHLDFHKTMENYCDTKAVLFSRCKKAVANCDDVWFDRILRGCRCDILTTSVQKEASLRAENVELYADRISFDSSMAGEKTTVKLPIPGKFTVYNAMTALGCAMQLGISLQDAAAALATAKGVKGRVEVVPTPGKPYTVLIDYAHTPDGLENVLSSVRGFCKGRLIAVFGCGGDRDPIKRPIMGRIGVELADWAIITSDNPRTEAPRAIIEDVVKGIPADKKNYEIIENRVSSIHHAMDIARKHDIIVLAGKGHETYQEIHGVKHHLDEREVVAAYLEETRE